MKAIAFVTLSLRKGGAERVVAQLCNYLVEFYDIHLFLIEEEIGYPIDSRVIIHNIGGKTKKQGLFGSALSFLNSLSGLKAIIKEHNIKILFSFLFRPNVISILSLRHLGIRLIISERSNPLVYYGSSRFGLINKVLIKILYPKADLITVNSNGCKNILEKAFHISPEKLSVIRNPVKITSIRKESSQIFRFITVGRLDKNKNQIMLIKAYQHFIKLLNVSNPIESIEFLIIGEGDEFNTLNEYINQHSLSSIKLLGVKNNVNEYLASSDIFLFGSRSEGFPNVILEAMVCNLPIISTDCAFGPGELLVNENHLPQEQYESYKVCENGILVGVDDYISMGEAMFKLYSNRYLIVELSKNYDLLLNQFRLETIGEEYKRLINEKSN